MKNKKIEVQLKIRIKPASKIQEKIFQQLESSGSTVNFMVGSRLWNACVKLAAKHPDIFEIVEDQGFRFNTWFYLRLKIDSNIGRNK
jgi:basic membrane lipoprotein Med (substrate-binding protein (PBP1-ABC) superfamily)